MTDTFTFTIGDGSGLVGSNLSLFAFHSMWGTPNDTLLLESFLFLDMLALDFFRDIHAANGDGFSDGICLTRGDENPMISRPTAFRLWYFQFATAPLHLYIRLPSSMALNMMCHHHTSQKQHLTVFYHILWQNDPSCHRNCMFDQLPGTHFFGIFH